MQLSQYQSLTKTTAIYPAIGHMVVYPALGLANESGEVLGKIKKVFRDKSGVFAPEIVQELSKELGDVLWYIAQVASELGLDLDAIATANIEKLLSRQERGVIGGSGDNR